MKLVTFGVSTPVGQRQRIGAMHLNKLIDLNMGYTCYLADKHGSGQSYELAAAMLPPDMIAFFRRGKEGEERAEMTIDYVVVVDSLATVGLTQKFRGQEGHR